jgi:hypothetical protein
MLTSRLAMHVCHCLQVVGDKLLAARDAPVGAAEKGVGDAHTSKASTEGSRSPKAAADTTAAAVAADGTEQLPSPEAMDGLHSLHSLTSPLLSAEPLHHPEGGVATARLPPSHSESGCARHV